MITYLSKIHPGIHHGPNWHSLRHAGTQVTTGISQGVHQSGWQGGLFLIALAIGAGLLVMAGATRRRSRSQQDG